MLPIALALVGVLASASEPPPPSLALDHAHRSGRWTFRTPEGWTVATPPGRPEVTEAKGDGLVVRFVHYEGEQGFDSLHVTCMLERLAPENAAAPQVKYEYDFLGGPVGDRRALDSAFVVRYDAAIGGHREWRQRNLTVVGGGMSLCAITYAPASAWKKSPPTRALLDAVLGSVRFR